MRNYDSYKDSGIEWIGEIPSHWQVNKVKHNFIFRTGFTPPSGKDEYYQGGNHVWINIGDLQERIVSDSITKITDKAIEDFNPTIVPEGSLLYSFKLSVGRVAFNAIDCYTNEAIFSIDPNGKANLRFFYYSLPEQIIKNANENIYGAKILNQELIKNACLIVPPTQEQTAIADYLDRKTAEIDELIADKKRLLELYEEEKTAIINQAVTKGLNPDPEGSGRVVPMKDSGIEWLGEIPEHWEVTSLKRLVATRITDGPHETPQFHIEGVPFVSAEAVKDNRIDFNYVRGYISKQDDLKYSLKCKPRRNDIFIVKSGSTTGKIAIVDCDSDFNIWSPLALIRVSKKVHHLYMFYSLQSDYFQNSVRIFWSYGTQPNIGMNIIENLKVAFPISIDEQSEIVSYIKKASLSIDAKTEKTKKLINLLTEYRTALISEVVTGKVKVV